MTHLNPILDKARAAQTRTQRTIAYCESIEAREANNKLTPEVEAALEPYLEILEAATVPDAAEYTVLDDALDNIEVIVAEA
jgi:hypothetical protein